MKPRVFEELFTRIEESKSKTEVRPVPYAPTDSLRSCDHQLKAWGTDTCRVPKLSIANVQVPAPKREALDYPLA